MNIHEIRATEFWSSNFRRFIETELMNHFLQSTMYCIFHGARVIFDNVESNNTHTLYYCIWWGHKQQIQHRNAQQSPSQCTETIIIIWKKKPQASRRTTIVYSWYQIEKLVDRITCASLHLCLFNHIETNTIKQQQLSNTKNVYGITTSASFLLVWVCELVFP